MHWRNLVQFCAFRGTEIVEWLRSVEERSARPAKWESWVQFLSKHVIFFYNLNQNMLIKHMFPLCACVSKHLTLTLTTLFYFFICFASIHVRKKARFRSTFSSMKKEKAFSSTRKSVYAAF